MGNKKLILLLLVIITGAVVWYFFHHIVIYIIIAGIFSLISQPVDNRLRNIKIGKFQFPAALSAALTLCILFLFFFLLAMIFTPLVMEEATIFSSMNGKAIMLSLREPINAVDNILRTYNIDFANGDIQNYFREKIASFLTAANLSLFFNQIIGALGDFFIAFFAISFLTFFFLRDKKRILNAALSFGPAEYSDKLKNVFTETERLLKRYFIGLLTEVLLVAAFLFTGLSIAGINHALLIALFAGIMIVIPYVGPLIGVGFALLIGLTTHTEMSMMEVVLRIIIVFPIVNISDAFLLQPLIYSNSVKAHPVEIFVVILMGAAIGGIGGMILAVPSYTILRVIAKEFFIHFRIVKHLTKRFDEKK